MHGGIEGSAPATVDNANSGFRIAASGYGPDDFFHVRGIDIIIDDDDEAAMIVSRTGAESSDSRLLRVPVVALFDRNDDKGRAAGGG